MFLDVVHQHLPSLYYAFLDFYLFKINNIFTVFLQIQFVKKHNIYLVTPVWTENSYFKWASSISFRII